MDRRLIIVITVVGLHLLGLWALHTGLLRRAVALVIPVQVLANLIEPPQPVVAPAAPAPPTPKPTPTPPKPVSRQPPPPKPVVRPAPPPLAGAVAEPSPQAPDAVTAPQPITSSAPVVAEVAQTAPAALPAPPAPPAPPRVDLPSSSADYLNNPTPPYPPLSKRMGEQGRVVIRARIEVNGSASKAEVRTSSGYERLDQAALQTVKRWRYLPGKRAGVPEAMWFNIPINFVLE